MKGWKPASWFSNENSAVDDWADGSIDFPASKPYAVSASFSSCGPIDKMWDAHAKGWADGKPMNGYEAFTRFACNTTRVGSNDYDNLMPVAPLFWFKPGAYFDELLQQSWKLAVFGGGSMIMFIILQVLAVRAHRAIFLFKDRVNGADHCKHLSGETQWDSHLLVDYEVGSNTCLLQHDDPNAPNSAPWPLRRHSAPWPLRHSDSPGEQNTDMDECMDDAISRIRARSTIANYDLSPAEDAELIRSWFAD